MYWFKLHLSMCLNLISEMQGNLITGSRITVGIYRDVKHYLKTGERPE